MSTCFASVDDELSRLEGPGLAQALATNTYTAGITDLRLIDHDRYGAARNMAAVLLDVHQMLSDLLRNE